VEGREREGRRGEEKGKGHEPPQYLEEVYAYENGCIPRGYMLLAVD